MLIRLVLFAALVAAVLWLLRWIMRTPPEQVARLLRRGLLWGGIGLVVLAAATGRLNPLFALLAAAIPVILRGLALVQLLPVVQQVLRGLGLMSPSGPNGSGDQHSRVRTAFLDMQLDHPTGQLDGTVLKGNWQGRRLSQLTLEQLLELLEECRATDGQSAAVLEAYLDRVHDTHWRAQAKSRGTQGEQGDIGPLSEPEARAILGVTAEAKPEEIRAAHRRLMQKYHPDRGGSDYLAAKINAAKQRLLNE